MWKSSLELCCQALREIGYIDDSENDNQDALLERLERSDVTHRTAIMSVLHHERIHALMECHQEIACLQTMQEIWEIGEDPLTSITRLQESDEAHHLANARKALDNMHEKQTRVSAIGYISRVIRRLESIRRILEDLDAPEELPEAA
jgi:hypothetical protein